MKNRNIGDSLIGMCNTELLQGIIEKLDGKSYGESVGTLVGALSYMIDSDDNLTIPQKMAMVHSISQTMMTIMMVRSSYEDTDEDTNENEQVH